MTEVAPFDDFNWVLQLSPENTEFETAQYFESSGKRAALLNANTLALWYKTLN
jgi:hypothetical protein